MIHNRRLFLSLVGLASLSLTTGVPHAAPDVNTIVEQAHHAAYYAGRDGRARVRMTITDGAGRTTERQFSMLRSNVEGGHDQKYLVVFERPSEMRKSVLLVHKHGSTDDDRWLFLPAMDLVKRIGAGDKRTSFVGSHFLYEDVSGRLPSEDTHELLRTTKNAYVLQGTPKNPSKVEFARYEAHIDIQTFLPRRIEYFDAAGRSLRTIEAKAMRRIGGHPTIVQIEVVDKKRGGKTLIDFESVQYDLEIPDTVFSERSLRHPPREWLRAQ